MKSAVIKKNKLRRFFLVLVFIIGLFTIVATSDDDNSDSDTTDDTTAEDTETGTDGNTAPVAAIVVPADETTFIEGALITLTGTGTDTEDGALSGASLYWSSSIDGRIGIGAVQKDVSLSTGTHTITFTATDGDGAAHGATITLTVNPVDNTLPTVEILTPADGDTFSIGEYITFTGTGTDTEDGDLTGSSLVWTSNKNKQIGIDSSFETDSLESGDHIITLTGTDSSGTKSTTAITITIKNTLPVATITWPGDETFSVGDQIVCNGTGYDEEDGNLSGSSLVWRLNGEIIWNGNSCNFGNLSAGVYIVALHVTDSAGETDVDTIEITVN